MKKTFMMLFIGSVIVLFGVVDQVAARKFIFAGGPSGGTYTHFANAISELAAQNGVDLEPKSTGGSIENIKKVQRNQAKFGISYSGDIYHAINGTLKRDSRRYNRVMAMGYFYSAAAQLVVRADSGITSTLQLKGRNVGVGNPGSGAANNCELFFNELGIWGDISRHFMGYKKASDAFIGKELDAFWLFTGYPNGSVTKAADSTAISLIHVADDARNVGLFTKHPYFKPIDIPANTYKGVETPTRSFQDHTIWIVNSRVPEEIVYRLLEIVYSEQGLKFMRAKHKAAKSMSVANGIYGIVTPLHPGAEKFWRDKGVLK